MQKINRRQLAKGIAAGLAVGSMSAMPGSAESANEERGLSWVEVLPGIWKGTLGMPEPHTPVSLRLEPPAIEGLRRLPAIKSPPIGEVQGAITPRGCQLSIPLAANEMIYGFGLQLLSFQHRGKKRTCRVNADPKGDSGDSHAPVPFYVTTKGYGIFVDTLRHADFYCGEVHTAPTHGSGTSASGVKTPADASGDETKKDSKVLVEVPRASGVQVYLFAGPTVLDVVRRYVQFSGGGVIPPEWGLGFWYRPEMHLSQEQVLSLARDFRARKIPCDVFGLEPGWQTHAYSCTFAWERSRFPDVPEFIKQLTAIDYKLNLWEHAFTNPASPIFEQLIPYSGNYSVWGGLVPDFAGEPARKIFGEYHGKQLIDAGVSGFKLDECDGSDFTGGWSFPDLSQFPSGLDGEQMHALFGLRYQHAIWQQFRDRSRPTYNLVRSSGAFSAPYPFVLYSDLYDHRQFIRALVNSGFSGLLWCPEVRDAVSKEDLVRRLQSVVFSPVAMVNAWYIKNPPWKQLDRQQNNQDHYLEDWESLEEQCREIIGWRMQLVPYLQAAFHRYAIDGTPPFRALVLDYPDDPALRIVDDQYLVGDRMLVAPLFAGENEREIVLPPGEWHDFWTGAAMKETRFKVPPSTRNIPVFVKAGSVLPLAGTGSSTASPEARELVAQVYGDGHLRWQLGSAEDSILDLRWDSATGKGSVRQKPSSPRPYTVSKWKQMS